MTYLSIIEKLQILFNTLLDFKFILVFIISVLLFTFLYSIKKLSGRRYMFFMIILFTLVFGISIIANYKILLNTFDNFTTIFFGNIYFPSIYVYITVMFISLITLIVSILNKMLKKIYKVINSTMFIINNILFVVILNIIAENKIDIFSVNSLYSNTTLVAILELSMGIFIIWFLSLTTVYITNCLCERLGHKRVRDKVSIHENAFNPILEIDYNETQETNIDDKGYDILLASISDNEIEDISNIELVTEEDNNELIINTISSEETPNIEEIEQVEDASVNEVIIETINENEVEDISNIELVTEEDNNELIINTISSEETPNIEEIEQVEDASVNEVIIETISENEVEDISNIELVTEEDNNELIINTISSEETPNIEEIEQVEDASVNEVIIEAIIENEAEDKEENIAKIERDEDNSSVTFLDILNGTIPVTYYDNNIEEETHELIDPQMLYESRYNTIINESMVSNDLDKISYSNEDDIIIDNTISNNQLSVEENTLKAKEKAKEERLIINTVSLNDLIDEEDMDINKVQLETVETSMLEEKEIEKEKDDVYTLDDYKKIVEMLNTIKVHTNNNSINVDDAIALSLISNYSIDDCMKFKNILEGNLNGSLSSSVGGTKN